MTSPAPHEWLHHLEDEADAAYLYRILADAESDPVRKKVFAGLAAVEDRHVQIWQRLLIEEEGKEVKGYLDLHKSGGAATSSAALTLARESAQHAESLAGLAGRSSEPWHKTGAGGFLRNVVYGFNDGLTANFGLVAGMLGAQGELNLSGHAVIVAGVAGMVADALSMGSSGYLAAK